MVAGAGVPVRETRDLGGVIRRWSGSVSVVGGCCVVSAGVP